MYKMANGEYTDNFNDLGLWDIPLTKKNLGTLNCLKELVVWAMKNRRDCVLQFDRSAYVSAEFAEQTNYMLFLCGNKLHSRQYL